MTLHPQIQQFSNRNEQHEIGDQLKLVAAGQSCRHLVRFNQEEWNLEAPKRTVKLGMPVNILMTASSSLSRGK